MIISFPPYYNTILEDSKTLGFNMLSNEAAGQFLRTLAASKLSARILELGTGTGLGLTWLADGADEQATIVSVESEMDFLQVAKHHFLADARIQFIHEDAAHFIQNYSGEAFDLIFADTWSGKYYDLAATLALVKVGGFYVIDDMLPQPNWPEGHDLKAAQLLNELQQRTDFHFSYLPVHTGLVLMTKKA
ncbi:MAG: class I SAM-dependent methyltransferase [Bacteroidota bacterium]